MAKQIVILGAGYGGIRTAHVLNQLLLGYYENYNMHSTHKIILIDKNDYHTLMTQLYQPAAGTASLNNYRVPIKELIRDKNIQFIKGNIDQIDLDNRCVIINRNEKVYFSHLVNALGNEPEYFGIEGLQQNSISINSFHKAAKIKLQVDDIIKNLVSHHERNQQASFVIGGGGLTGVEFAGELAERLQCLKNNYCITGDQFKIVLVEGSENLLPGMSSTVYTYAKQALQRLGVEVITGDFIKKATADTVYLASGRKIPYNSFIWAGGIRGNSIAAKSGLATDQRGRVLVNHYLQCQQHEKIYAIGDSALVKDAKTGEPVIATAQAAMQQGTTAAYNVYADILGLQKKKYIPSLICLLIHIGSQDAVGEPVNKFKNIKLKGSLAAWIKNLIPLKYSFVVGGVKMLLNNFRRERHSVKYELCKCNDSK